MSLLHEIENFLAEREDADVLNRIDRATREFYHAVKDLHASIAERHRVGRFLVIRDITDISNEPGPGQVVCAEFKSPSVY